MSEKDETKTTDAAAEKKPAVKAATKRTPAKSSTTKTAAAKKSAAKTTASKSTEKKPAAKKSTTQAKAASTKEETKISAAEAKNIAEVEAKGQMPKKKAPQNVAMSVCVIACVVALVVGGLLGTFVFGKMSFGTISGLTYLSENQLDTAVASYTYDGTTKSVTARDALDAASGVDAAKQENGSYTMPSADSIVSYVRNAILAKQAEKEGIDVTDEDATKYAEEMTGSSDFKQIASQYSMTEDQVKTLMTSEARTKKLYTKVVGEDVASGQPEAPEALAKDADGKDVEDTPNEKYAQYIIKIAGDEWDATKGAWKNANGDFANAFKNSAFNGKTATYAQANSAYNVVYQAYSAKQQTASTNWTKYVNDLFAKCNLTIYEVVN